MALHGKLPQSERQEAMRRFRQGEAHLGFPKQAECLISVVTAGSLEFGTNRIARNIQETIQVACFLLELLVWIKGIVQSFELPTQPHGNLKLTRLQSFLWVAC